MRTLPLIGAALMALSTVADAQVAPEIAEQIRAAGQSMDPAIGSAYAPLFPESAWEGVRIERDIAYGPDTLHRLDIYADEEGGAGRPVLLFVHGGGFVRGDKHGTFYPDNIPLWAAKQGMVGVTINYRLAPANAWPAAAQDLRAAIEWVRANIAEHGGDPDRIVLWGHSAGANHVADYVAHPDLRGAEAEAIRGAVLLSPFYAPAPGDEPHAYYGSDPALLAAPQAIERLARAEIPLFLSYAEFDPQMMKEFADSLSVGLCSAGECARTIYLRDHNHFTEGMAVGTRDESLTGPLLDWMRPLLEMGD
jgi:triacylglycerol lipase